MERNYARRMREASVNKRLGALADYLEVSPSTIEECTDAYLSHCYRDEDGCYWRVLTDTEAEREFKKQFRDDFRELGIDGMLPYDPMEYVPFVKGHTFREIYQEDLSDEAVDMSEYELKKNCVALGMSNSEAKDAYLDELVDFYVYAKLDKIGSTEEDFARQYILDGNEEDFTYMLNHDSYAFDLDAIREHIKSVHGRYNLSDSRAGEIQNTYKGTTYYIFDVLD